MTKKILLLITLTFSGPLFAGLVIDPYLAYRNGGYDVPLKAGGKYEYDHTGHELGLRLGASSFGFMAGFQYGLGSTSVKQKATPSGVSINSGEDEYDTSAAGLFVGFKGLPFFRFWGTYFFNYEWEASKSNTTTGTIKGDYLEGSGYSIGVGFTGVPFLSLNVEYRLANFDEKKDGSVITSLPSSTREEYDVEELLLSVSAPFDLF